MNEYFVGEKLRPEPEVRAHSALGLKAKPKARTKPKIERSKGLGKRLGEPLPRNFLII